MAFKFPQQFSIFEYRSVIQQLHHILERTEMSEQAKKDYLKYYWKHRILVDYESRLRHVNIQYRQRIGSTRRLLDNGAVRVEKKELTARLDKLLAEHKKNQSILKEITHRAIVYPRRIRHVDDDKAYLYSHARLIELQSRDLKT